MLPEAIHSVVDSENRLLPLYGTKRARKEPDETILRIRDDGFRALALGNDLFGSPQAWLVGFGESSLDFERVVWIKQESVKRPEAVEADYNWALETALSKYGIEIPFPQRDLHIRSGTLPINLSAESRSPVPKPA